MRPRPALDDFLARVDAVLADANGEGAPESQTQVRTMPPPQVHTPRWSARGVFSRR